MGYNTGVYGDQGAVSTVRKAPTTSAVLLAAASPSRNSLTLVNVGAVDCWIGNISTLTTSANSTKLAATQSVSLTGSEAKAAWYGITASSTADISVTSGKSV